MKPEPPPKTEKRNEPPPWPPRGEAQRREFKRWTFNQVQKILGDSLNEAGRRFSTMSEEAMEKYHAQWESRIAAERAAERGERRRRTKKMRKTLGIKGRMKGEPRSHEHPQW